MAGASAELLRDLSRFEVCGRWDACKGFLLPGLYLGAHMGSDAGLGFYKLGIPLEWVLQSGVLEAGEAGSLLPWRSGQTCQRAR